MCLHSIVPVFLSRLQLCHLALPLFFIRWHSAVRQSTYVESNRCMRMRQPDTPHKMPTNIFRPSCYTLQPVVQPAAKYIRILVVLGFRKLMHRRIGLSATIGIYNTVDQ